MEQYLRCYSNLFNKNNQKKSGSHENEIFTSIHIIINGSYGFCY